MESKFIGYHHSQRTPMRSITMRPFLIFLELKLFAYPYASSGQQVVLAGMLYQQQPGERSYCWRQRHTLKRRWTGEPRLARLQERGYCQLLNKQKLTVT